MSRNSDRSVVVGIDGSDNADHALRWAVDKASVLGPVTPVMVTPSPTQDTLRGIGEGGVGATREAATAHLRRTVESVDPALANAGVVIEDHPARGLVEAAADAALLVVGTRGQSGFTSTLLGSVSSYCATTAEVPVAIIPPESPTDRPLLDVVVGVDGSQHADAALRWALRHLAPGGRLRAVGALPIWGAAEDSSVPLEQRLGDRVQASIDRVLAETPLGEVDGREITIITATRDARVVLRELAEGADLVVIGRRGLSRLAFLVLGSVAAAVTHHPSVPTVVIPNVEAPEPQER